jgi:hypothetical protein
MHIFSYDFYFFPKKGMILYSWLPIQTYPKKMVSLKKKTIPQNLAHFWAIFFHPKILSIRQNDSCEVKI